MSGPKAETLNLQELFAVARVDFATFIEVVFPVLHPAEPLKWAPYIEATAVCLQACGEDIQQLVINMPPGYLKSMLVSILYVAWRLGQNPTLRFICISYGDDLAHHLSSRVRDLMQSPVYRAIFPGTVLKKKSESMLETTKGGYRYSTAVGSDITGFRADYIIIDDPLQPEEAASATKKKFAIDWIRSSVLTRFKDPANGVLITVMHRLAPDDPAGHLESAADVVLKFALVAEEEEEVYFGGELIFHRLPGQLLHPGRFSIKELKELEKRIPPHVRSSQYQQRPVSAGSGMLTISRLWRYKTLPPFELKLHSWDIAATPEGNYSVCSKWGVAKTAELGDVLYLTGIVRMRVESPDVREAIVAQDKLDKPDLIVLDGIGIGLGIVQDLQKRGYRHVFPHSYLSEISSSKKIERFGMAQNYMYDGKVRFPECAPYLDGLFDELVAFPNGQYDDQVDSVCQLVSTMENSLMFARQKLRPENL